jgi:hypothetical protein
MKKQLLIIGAILASTFVAPFPATAAGFTISVGMREPGPRFEGRWERPAHRLYRRY